ncbi:hypothetical protein BDY24DRAFT_388722 [Mrakia frigida]|uniref:uncharacterized protein n=1 Tax=Mrakia frigida TaxID=29902 RepID=UPI003FCBF729
MYSKKRHVKSSQRETESPNEGRREGENQKKKSDERRTTKQLASDGKKRLREGEKERARGTGMRWDESGREGEQKETGTQENRNEKTQRRRV